MIKNLHYVDCLLLHGWSISKLSDKQIKDHTKLVRIFYPKREPLKLMWVSPRYAFYYTNSAIHVPQEVVDDALEHGDFNG